MIEHSVFSIMTGLIVEMCPLSIMLCNGLKISEYKVHRLMDFPLVDNQVYQKELR